MLKRAELIIRNANLKLENDAIEKENANSEETKRKNKNLIINNLKKQSTNIIKELDASGKSI